MEKGQESKQKRKTPLTTIAISQEYAKKLDEYLNGTGITRKEFVELSVDYFQRTGFDLRGEAFYCNDTPEHIEMFYQFHKQGFCSLFLDTGDK